jgi:hypothetical protein
LKIKAPVDLTLGAEGETTYWLDSTSCDTKKESLAAEPGTVMVSKGNFML